MALEAFVNGKKKKKGEKVGETLRFEFELAPSSEDSCNEFFYTQLVEEKTEKVRVVACRWCMLRPTRPFVHRDKFRMHAFDVCGSQRPGRR